MEETTFAVWRIDGVDVVQAAGVVDFAAAVRLRLTLFGQLDAGARHIVVDLSGVRLLDASAVNVLLRVHERLADQGGSLFARGARGLVLEVLEISGAAKKLGAYEPLEPALTDPSADIADATDTANLRDQAASRPSDLHGLWGDNVNDLIGRLHGLPDADPGRAALRDELIRLCLPFVERLARRFYGLGEPVNDLNQVAALGLLKAVDRYDPTLGTDFPSYATPTVVGELKRHFRDRGWAVRVPRRLQELRLEINRARTELTHELNRSPSLRDLAEWLDIDEEQVIEALTAAGGYRATSLFAPVGGAEDGLMLLEMFGIEDDRLAAVDTHESLQPLLARLPERERSLIAMRFFGNLTQAQIADRLGISQMHVSRLLARTLARLREGMLATD